VCISLIGIHLIGLYSLIGMHLIGLYLLIGVYLIGISLINVYLTYRRAFHRYAPGKN
jgi:hypothetical protein